MVKLYFVIMQHEMQAWHTLWLSLLNSSKAFK
nr:MAG TPA: hypothetical protein [Caudoviricetes sp.]